MKKIFTLFAAVAAFASVNAQQLYLVGDINSWNISSPIAMTLGADGKTNTYELNLSKAQNIFVCTAAASGWDEMNAGLRYAITQNKNVSITQSGNYQLITVSEGNFNLSPGEWTITVNAETMAATFTKKGSVETFYHVTGGSAELFGNTWGDALTDDNKMVKQADGTYKKTYDGVTLTAGDIMYKIVRDGGTYIPDGTGNDNILNIPEDGTYNVVFTYNPAGDPDLEGLTTTGEATSTTGISLVKVSDSVPTVYYNLKGQRVNADTKGILIANGKKFVR